LKAIPYLLHPSVESLPFLHQKASLYGLNGLLRAALTSSATVALTCESFDEPLFEGLPFIHV
jgi:hypothetical protein